MLIKKRISGVINFSKYFSISIIEKGFNYLITLSLAYFISPEELGKLSLFFAVYAFIYPLINISTDGFLTIQWQKDNEHYSGYYSSASMLNFINAIVIAVFLLLIYYFSPALSNIPFWAIILIPIVSLFDSVRKNFLSYTVVTNKFKQYGTISILYTFFSLMLTFIILFYFKRNYSARVFGFCLASAMVYFIIFFLQRKIKLTGTGKYSFLKPVFLYGVMLIPHAIGQIIVDLSDRFFINAMSTQKELGFYSLAYSLTSVIALISSSFFLSWVPKMNKLLFINTKESLEKIAKTHTIFLITLLAFTALTYFASLVVIKYMLPPAYKQTVQFLPYLALTYFFQGVYLCSAGVLFYTQKNSLFLYASVINILLNIILNYFLINLMGAMGAAYATLISMIVFSLLITYISYKKIRIPWFYYLKK